MSVCFTWGKDTLMPVSSLSPALEGVGWRREPCEACEASGLRGASMPFGASEASEVRACLSERASEALASQHAVAYMPLLGLRRTDTSALAHECAGTRVRGPKSGVAVVHFGGLQSHCSPVHQSRILVHDSPVHLSRFIRTVTDGGAWTGAGDLLFLSYVECVSSCVEPFRA